MSVKQSMFRIPGIDRLGSIGRPCQIFHRSMKLVQSVRYPAGRPLRSLTVQASDVSDVAIVTGASRGIGKAIALGLGAAGCRVAVNYSSSSGAAEEVAQQIIDLGGDAIVVGANCGKVSELILHQNIESNSPVRNVSFIIEYRKMKSTNWSKL